MIKIEKTNIFGWEDAIRGMRNPMNSWNRSDSGYCNILSKLNKAGCEICPIKDSNPSTCYDKNPYIIGPNDFDLMKRLRNAGTDHRKFMRMIAVYVDITAPDYWFSEFDTYKIGTVANSTSTMHKIMSKPFTPDMFSVEKLRGYKKVVEYIPNEIDEDTEEWKSWEANPLYEVSNQGRIKRKQYKSSNNNVYKERILCGSKHDDGYIIVNILMQDGSRKQIPKHRIVAEVFIPNPERKPEVNHIDGNKMNNNVSNLEWFTSSENEKHAYEEYLQPHNIYTYKGKLTKEQRDEIIKRYNTTDVSKRQLAKEYDVSHTTICSITNNKYNYGDGYKNEYQEFIKLINELNELRDEWLITKDKDVWYEIIQKLPRSYNYTRTVMMNYEVLANIYKSRKNHKLDEWREFCEWIETLPYSELIIGEKKEGE